ncbi:hypothetical protein [Mycobacterium marinum]|uniref:hypothetical protein n=1 Tax=Mycobacterium marinum TaxID=1781 RepID=UPI00045FC68A|nr:hypothetical protein [Mycobacterium marinum]CDM77652.1 hypothetical protein MMARE11_35110 [Mycobacterium marinum E11]
MPKKKPLRSIDELLADVRPIDPPGVDAWFGAAADNVISLESALSAKQFPVPALVRYILVARGGMDLGRAEKTAWRYAFMHENWLLVVSHRKFGLRLTLWCSAGAEEAARSWVRRFVGRLAASQRDAEAKLAEVAGQEIAAGNVTLQNQYPQLRLTYEYFREGVEVALAGKGRIPERSPGGGFWFAREEREAFYNIVAMCGAYFSMLEHVLVLAIPFMLNRHSAPVDVRTVIGMTWPDKYRYVLGTDAGPSTDYLSKLVMIAERYRNTYGHGAFGKDDATTYFHAPGVGAIPGNMTRVRESPQFSLVPAAEADFSKVCAVFDGWEVDIAGGDLWAAWDWIRSGLDVRYDRTFCTEVDLALSEERFDDLIEEWSLKWERHANMDY